MAAVKLKYYEVRIAWKDERGYVETCRQITADDQCESVRQAIDLTERWSTSCPDNSAKWLSVSAVLKGGEE